MRGLLGTGLVTMALLGGCSSDNGNDDEASADSGGAGRSSVGGASTAASGSSRNGSSTGGTKPIATSGFTNGGAASGGSAAGGSIEGGGSSGLGGSATGGSATGGSATGGSATGGSATGGAATGGSATGGAATGGSATGSAATGGSATGGSATGGSATGGAATGGSATGGSATGGSATGGAATGGAATGGAATGGAATGGAATGGAPACATDPIGAALDPCAGIICKPRVGGTCLDDHTYTSSDGPGVCVQGSCQYAQRTTTCTSCQAGVCVVEGCSSGCNNPPAPVCSSAQLLTNYFPTGTCNAGACSYQPISTICMAGCLNGACLPGSTAQRLPNREIWTDYVTRLAIDDSLNVHIAECMGGTLHYLRRSPTGWSDELIEKGLGSCQAAIAVTPDGVATIVYAVTSTTPAQVRAARQTSSGTFEIELVALNTSTYSLPSVSMDPASKPVVAFAANDGVRVARPNQAGAQPWPNELAIAGAYSGVGPIQVLVDATGRTHVIRGAQYSGSATLPRSEYNRTTATGAWVSTTAQVIDGGITHRPMVVDDAGVVNIFSTINNNLVGPSPMIKGNYLRVARIAPDGSTSTEWVEKMASGDGVFALRGYDGRVGSLSTKNVRTRRIAANYYQRLARTELKSVQDVVIGRDGAVRTFGWDVAGTSEQLLTEPCTRFCTGHDCGDDGCGGHCGTCGSCQTCDPERRLCNELASERIGTLEAPTIDSVAPLTDGSLLAITYDSMSDSSLRYARGTAGSWTYGTGTIPTHNLISSPDFQQVRTKDKHITRWGGNAFTELVYYPTESVGAVAVGNDGTTHRLFNPNSDRSKLNYSQITSEGVVTTQTLESDSVLEYFPSAILVSASGARYAHFMTRSIGSNPVYSYYYGVASETGSFTFTQTPNDFGSAHYFAVDDNDTEWVIISGCSTGSGGGYLFGTAGAGWSGKGCAAVGAPLTVPYSVRGWVFTWDRKLRLAAEDGIYTLSGNSGRFERMVAVPVGAAAYDSQNRLHSFFTESVNGVNQLRHFYQP